MSARHRQEVLRFGISGTHTGLIKRIELSEEVYRQLKREKGNRGFSEVTADALDSGGRLSDLVSQQALDPELAVPFKTDTERPNDGMPDFEDT